MEDTRMRIEQYMSLIKDRPELFTDLECFPIVTDAETLMDYEKRTGKKIGVIYGYGSPFYMLIVDLINGKNGMYTYSRIVYPNKSNGSVIIPCIMKKGERLFGLLEIYRHPIRGKTGSEFPRGFADKGCSPDEDALRELKEELKLKVNQKVNCMTFLGRVNPDAGLSGGSVSVFLAEISEVHDDIRDESEGIQHLFWVKEDEILKLISENKITDGFTLSAFMMYLSKDKNL